MLSNSATVTPHANTVPTPALMLRIIRRITGSTSGVLDMGLGVRVSWSIAVEVIGPLKSDLMTDLFRA